MARWKPFSQEPATSWPTGSTVRAGEHRRARTGLPASLSAHQALYPIRTMAQGPEGFGHGLLRWQRPTSFGSGDRRRRSDASYPQRSTLDQAWNLWRRRVFRRWRRLRGLIRFRADSIGGYRQMLAWMRSAVGTLQRIAGDRVDHGSQLGLLLASCNKQRSRSSRSRLGQAGSASAWQERRSRRAERRHAAFAGQRTVTPRSRDGMIRSLRVLKACRKTAVSSRRIALQMIHNTIVCAPDGLGDHHRYRSLANRSEDQGLRRELASPSPKEHSMLDAMIDALKALPCQRGRHASSRSARQRQCRKSRHDATHRRLVRRPNRQGRSVSDSRRIGRIQAVVATRSLSADRRNRSSASAGVFQSKRLSGPRVAGAAATAAISLALCMLRSVPLGKYWRSSPLVFSLVPRCHGL